MQVEKTVFISYRRTNAMTARAVYQDLTHHGYDCFMDFQSIDSGAFDQIILRQIAARAHFILILTPSAMERCIEPGDWLRREIEEAMQLKRNLVPLMFEDFNFSPVQKYLVGDYLPLLSKYNGIRFPVDYFEEAMARLRTRHLNVPLEMVIHPTLAADRAAVAEQQNEIAAQPAVTTEQLSAEASFERANRAYESKDYDQAIADYDAAIRLNPQYTAAYFNRGTARRVKNDLTGAIADYDTAIRLDPQYAPTYNNRGFARQTKGDLDGAIADYDAAIRLNPQYTAAYIFRGSAREAKRDLGGALDDYQRYLELGGGIRYGDQVKVEKIIRNLKKQIQWIQK
jgi:tetratricopeptide (TPR) repeat protein